MSSWAWRQFQAFCRAQSKARAKMAQPSPVWSIPPVKFIILSMCFEDPPNNYCCSALKTITLQSEIQLSVGIFLFTLVGVRTKPRRKSLVLSEVGCVCCNTEVHLGKSLQILEGLDPEPFTINDDTALDFNRGRIKMGAFANSPGQFYKLHVVFTQFYLWLKNNEGSLLMKTPFSTSKALLYDTLQLCKFVFCQVSRSLFSESSTKQRYSLFPHPKGKVAKAELSQTADH